MSSLASKGSTRMVVPVNSKGPLIDSTAEARAVLKRGGGAVAAAAAPGRASGGSRAPAPSRQPPSCPRKGAAQAALYGAALAARAERQGFPDKLKGFAKQVIDHQQVFTAVRADLEQRFDAVAPCLQSDPKGQTLDAGLPALEGLLEVLGRITKLQVVGEPSADNNLNVQVQGYRERLQELLDRPPLKGLRLQAAGLNAAAIGAAAEPLRQAVVAARKYCGAQDEALLNTLSQAWQKPDFCIRRDAVGPERDRLLTVTGSWDDEWYYGGLLTEKSAATDSTPKARS